MRGAFFLKCVSSLVLPIVLSGCGFMGIGKSEFSCPGGSTDGVRCLGARKVYEATEQSDQVIPLGADGAPTEALTYTPPEGGDGARVAVPTFNQPLPIRSQARVMRIWLGTWEDGDGDLHADGYLYSEIEGRKWSLGERVKIPGAMAPLSSGSSYR